MVAKKTVDEDKGKVEDKSFTAKQNPSASDEEAANLERHHDELVQDGKFGQDNTKTSTRDAKQHEIIAEDERRSNEYGQRVHHSLVEEAAATGNALRTLYDEDGNQVLVLDARPTEYRYYDRNGYPTEPAKRPENLAPLETDPKNLVKQVAQGFIVLDDSSIEQLQHAVEARRQREQQDADFPRDQLPAGAEPTRLATDAPEARGETVAASAPGTGDNAELSPNPLDDTPDDLTEGALDLKDVEVLNRSTAGGTQADAEKANEQITERTERKEADKQADSRSTKQENKK